MIEKTFLVPVEARDFINKLERSVRRWADSCDIGIGWNTYEDRVEVSFYDATDEQIAEASQRLEAVIRRYERNAPPKPPPQPVVPASLMVAMEWGYKAAEKGWNINKAIEEFTKLHAS